MRESRRTVQSLLRSVIIFGYRIYLSQPASSLRDHVNETCITFLETTIINRTSRPQFDRNQTNPSHKFFPSNSTARPAISLHPRPTSQYYTVRPSDYPNSTTSIYLSTHLPTIQSQRSGRIAFSNSKNSGYPYLHNLT